MSESYETYAGSTDQRVTLSAGTAFKIGFFGALGAAVVGIVLSIVFGILGAILGVGLFAAL